MVTTVLGDTHSTSAPSQASREGGQQRQGTPKVAAQSPAPSLPIVHTGRGGPYSPSGQLRTKEAGSSLLSEPLNLPRAPRLEGP